MPIPCPSFRIATICDSVNRDLFHRVEEALAAASERGDLEPFE
jgi:hypothetical protein